MTFASGQCRLTASIMAAISGYFSRLDFFVVITVQRLLVFAFTQSLITPKGEQLNRCKLLRCTAFGPISKHLYDTLTVLF